MKSEGGPVIHEISAWSGQPNDEAPICGADYASSFSRRTVYTAHVTCSDCIALRASWDAMHDDHVAEDESLLWAAEGESEKLR